MNWKKAGAVVSVVAWSVGVNLKAQETDLVVRIFDNYRVPAGDLLEAKAEAAATLRAAGINVTWIDCWHGDRQPAEAPARCRQEVRGDVVLRLQRATQANNDRYISLGFSLVMPEGVPFLATVYADLAEGVALRAGAAAHRVLGRAIAHEIGHLLLNTNSHPKEGLMRAAWSQRELRSNDSHDWNFREPEVATLKAAAAGRSRERNGERRANDE
jgi:hypothetical protein